MKKNKIFHPKLYFKYQSESNGIKLFYYSNKLNHLGKRLVQEIVLDVKIFSNTDIYKMNNEQYHNLLIYITRQEKVMSTYLKKGFRDQYLIVKDSLDLMHLFKQEFENWFLDYNNSLAEA
tara:strand:+ start:15121 stop:15480 length:360 start_codon:yes stop_codon:yes gene_type:complete